MAKEVRIKLTDAQRSKIKSAIGKNMTEIRVTSLGGSTKAVSARALRADTAKSAVSARALRADTAKSAVSARAMREISSESARAMREISSESARALRSGEDI